LKKMNWKKEAINRTTQNFVFVVDMDLVLFLQYVPLFVFVSIFSSNL
jgi:hypothetical protein